ncbi:hypothetical protein H5410_015826 [Solanum commersonii]|uniref:Uncharacterized protein n=1 Tax=Solanum commersonii TaxID=4109 RepID=A0A9J5ZVJ8_SOLCO|nr:hypothetical protein H5410_015826 [Solanum commersonii]
MSPTFRRSTEIGCFSSVSIPGKSVPNPPPNIIGFACKQHFSSRPPKGNGNGYTPLTTFTTGRQPSLSGKVWNPSSRMESVYRADFHANTMTNLEGSRLLRRMGRTSIFAFIRPGRLFVGAFQPSSLMWLFLEVRTLLPDQGNKEKIERVMNYIELALLDRISQPLPFCLRQGKRRWVDLRTPRIEGCSKGFLVLPSSILLFPGYSGSNTHGFAVCLLASYNSENTSLLEASCLYLSSKGAIRVSVVCKSRQCRRNALYEAHTAKQAKENVRLRVSTPARKGMF